MIHFLCLEYRGEKLENKKTVNYNILIKSVIATAITILMFTPLFGGILTILNGTFVYFSYFLVVFLLVAYMVLEVIDFIKASSPKAKQNESKEAIKVQKLLFSYTSLIIMIGLLQGRYIVQPILGILFIVIELFQLYRYIANPSYQQELERVTLGDRIKKGLFFLTSLMLLLGNQPFESMGIPVATALLLVLDIVTMINVLKKQNKQLTTKK